ncbi:stage II sporulation protein P [Amphibacillus sp. Q70]|uniref:stage II sporulation protein P n=1 Tax=Amphibacillus sp. Q70 TaxID=3453416 RepID=UPI003F85D16F
MSKLTHNYQQSQFSIFGKCLLIWIVLCFVLFSIVGAIVSVPVGKKSSHTSLLNITENISADFYLTMLTAELRPLKSQYDEALPNITFSDFLLQFTTQLNRTDIRTLFGNELPGFYPYQHRIIIGQADTNYSNLPVESSAPLETILEDRSVIDSPPVADEGEGVTEEVSEKTVFIYNTHNRESFLPHLDDVTDPNAAFHPEVNVTLISEQMKQTLATKGIGALVDQTDFTQVLHDQGWEYWQSYEASKPVVEEAFSQNEELNYVFDIHRDSRRKEDTTITIDDQDYARLFFVVGADFDQNEKNIELATVLHEELEKEYPGLSRGVVEMGGSGRNGVYNQDVSENAILIEFGGVDNTLEELYRTAEAFADIFADYYWDAEQASSN